MKKSLKFFIVSTFFMSLGLILLSTSILLYAFLGYDYICLFNSIILSSVSLIFFGLGGFFLYKYDEIATENDIPPRVLPSLSVMMIFIVADVCLIYYLAINTFLDITDLMTALMVAGIILDTIVVAISGIMFVTGIRDFTKKNKKNNIQSTNN